MPAPLECVPEGAESASQPRARAGAPLGMAALGVARATSSVVPARAEPGPPRFARLRLAARAFGACFARLRLAARALRALARAILGRAPRHRVGPAAGAAR